ncbi:MAG: polysaccharide biosynthesis protein [Alphaproteobacteria bacterium]|nr:polysaccharide biosynthesis protein [Alphaproteobacteria bacterium]
MGTRPFNRNIIAGLHDSLMAAASFVLALYLRLGNDMSFAQEFLRTGTRIFTVVATTVFISMGLYRGLWRFASAQDAIAIVKSVTLALLVFFPLLFMLTRLEGMPRSALVINWLLLIVMLGAPRFLYRIVKDRGVGTLLKDEDPHIPVLLMGATHNAELFLRETAKLGHSSYRVMGIIDDSREHIGTYIHRVRVYGPMASLERVVEKLGRKGKRPVKLIVTDPQAGGESLRALLARVDALGMTLARLPALTDFKGDVAEKTTLKPVVIEDLLGRAQKTRDLAPVRDFIRGTRVLVTGAGGTIGGELARQIAASEPAELLLFDHSEYALYRIDQELGARFAHIPRRALLGDVRDLERVQALFAQYRPELVFHAAAIKHVPIAEDNPVEAIRTNVIGTRNLADTACEYGARAMVMISTDKAVNPTNVMGATKRLAEQYCHALGDEGKAGKTKLMTVRFGNVLGSTGSVVPLFRQQIEAGGPVTVTDPRMTRYFMTVREAVELVIQASATGAELAGQNGMIFVLDMGEPVRIEELARQMIRLAGLSPDTDIAIRHVGLRPGEKLYEELFYADEAPKPLAEGVMLAHPRRVPLKPLQKNIEKLAKKAFACDMDGALALLAELVPEYRVSPVSDAA